LLSKPVLDVKIFSFNPTKLAQLLLKRFQQDGTTSSSAVIQETYAGPFPCLLRRGLSPTQGEGESDREDPHPF
jgi:hypothetical protein